MMKFMMLSSLLGGQDSGAGSDTVFGAGAAAGANANMNLLMPLLLMKGGGPDDLFGNLFDEENDADDADALDAEADVDEEEDLF